MSIFKCPNCHGEGLPDNELPCWKCGSGKRATERESGWQEKHRWPPYTHGRILCKCGAVVATCRCSKGCEVVGTVESCETCKPVGSLQQQGPLSERAALTEVSSHVSQITVNDFVCAVGEMTNADALARVKHLVNAENAERLRAEVSSPATPKNRYGCKQCQRDFNHEPFTVSIGGIPARTYFFCTTICRERWNMGYTGEPPQFPNTEQVIRVAGNVRAASPATPALEQLIETWRADWTSLKRAAQNDPRDATFPTVAAYNKAMVTMIESGFIRLNQLEKALADVARTLPASQEEKK